MLLSPGCWWGRNYTTSHLKDAEQDGDDDADDDDDTLRKENRVVNSHIILMLLNE